LLSGLLAVRPWLMTKGISKLRMHNIDQRLRRILCLH
jgi:hypothetical protein